MKIRKSFVTNSSSSSFIIAVKKGVTLDEVKDEVLKQDAMIKEKMHSYNNRKTLDKLVDDVSKEILRSGRSGMDIADWSVAAKEFSSEDGIKDDILFSLNEINTDKVKFRG